MFTILRIPERESYIRLRDEGFIMSRKCSAGPEGLAVAVMIAYFSQLALAQNTLSNNVFFFEPTLHRLRRLNQPLTYFLGYFNRLQNQSATHDEFATSLKSVPSIYEELEVICNLIFSSIDPNSYDRVLLTISDLSEALNFSLNLYGLEGLIKEFNYCSNSYPLTLDILQKGEVYFVLYRSNYETYYKQPRGSLLFDLKRLNIDKYETAISAALDCFENTIYGEDDLKLMGDLFDIAKSDNNKKFSFEERFGKLLNYTCYDCKKKQDVYKFLCGCFICKSCLKSLILSDICPLCSTALALRDQNIILSISI